MPPPTFRDSCSAKDIGLHSKEASRFPTFDFPPVSDVQVPIAIFTCLNPLQLCIAIKKWQLCEIDRQLHEIDSDHYVTTECLRIETQELEKLERRTEGKLILLEGAATLGSSRSDSVGVSREASGAPIGIMGLFMPKDRRVRWFYAAVPFKSILTKLADDLKLITLRKLLEPGTKHHEILYVFLREFFSRDIQIPHHPDYTTAMTITDYAPEILVPDTMALDRLLNNDAIQHKDFLDLSDDRYLHELELPEREIASLVRLRCAEYLLLKRNFFKDFYVEVYRKRNDDKQARTMRDHQDWLEAEPYEWTPTRARRLIAAWKLLGILDERRFVPWIREGGLLAEETEFEDLEDYDRNAGKRNFGEE